MRTTAVLERALGPKCPYRDAPVLRRCYLVARTTCDQVGHPRTPNIRGGLAAVSCMVALAACGYSQGPKNHAGSPTYSKAIEFANCMRAHGVPGFPDPSGTGGSIILAGSGTPAFESASRACTQLAPGGRGGLRATESQFLAALSFARCMRAHGVPDLPDPTRGSGPAPYANLTLGHGLYFRARPGFNPGAPAVLRAAMACRIARWESGP
jgi:hypothetical protein